VVKVRAMDFANGQLVLGTKNNEVLRVDLQSRQVTVLIEVHAQLSREFNWKSLGCCLAGLLGMHPVMSNHFRQYVVCLMSRD